jgi:hypothetical protein
MKELASFEDVIRAVAAHVDETRHIDIRCADNHRAMRTGYCCHECDGAWWVAPVNTIHDLPRPIGLRCKDTSGRIAFVREIIKKALEPKPYCPTSWERLLRA